MYETWIKGKIAELQIQLIAASMGITVSVPTVDARYDFILDIDGTLYKAQVKYADQTQNKGSVVVDLRRETRSATTEKRIYSKKEIDVLLVYIPKIDKVLWVEPKDFENKTCLTFRYEACKSSQTKGIRWVENYIWKRP